MNVYTVKQKSKAVFGSVLGLLVLSLLVLGCPPPGPKNCADTYPGEHRFDNDTVWGRRTASGDSMVFEFTTHCAVADTDKVECECQWQVQTLSLVTKNAPDYELDGEHTLALHIPRKIHNIDTTVTLALRGSTANPDSLVAYDHTRLTLELPQGFPTDPVFLLMGGLCVVVNVDGGSGPTQ